MRRPLTAPSWTASRARRRYRGASEAAPRRLRLNAEVLACGVAPGDRGGAGHRDAIATAASSRAAPTRWSMSSNRAEEGAEGRRSLSPAPSRPGSHRLRRQRHRARGGAAARAAPVDLARDRDAGGGRLMPWCRWCAGPGSRSSPRATSWCRRPEPLPPGGIYDSNAAILCGRGRREGGEPVPMGIFRDDEAVLEAAVRRALAAADLVVMSGGTSKGAGIVSHRLLSRLGAARGAGAWRGAEARQAAVPGRGRCQARWWCCRDFPTSAVFTFQEFVVPVIRAAGRPAPRARRPEVERVGGAAPSEAGRTEYVMVSLAEESAEAGLVAWPLGKGSGQRYRLRPGGWLLRHPRAGPGRRAGGPQRVRLIGGARVAVPDLAGDRQPLPGPRCRDVAPRGSRCARACGGGKPGRAGGGEAGRMRPGAGASAGCRDGSLQHALPRTRAAPGAGLAADAGGGVPPPATRASRGWRGRRLRARGGSRLPHGQPQCRVRHAHPARWRARWRAAAGPCQPAPVAQCCGGGGRQGRADWGLAIAPVARHYGLGFLPLAEEHYDFFIPEARVERAAVQAFLRVLASEEARERLRTVGMVPAA